MQHEERRRVHRARTTPVASQLRLLPSNANAHHGTARNVPSAVPHVRRAGPLRATWCEKLPEPCASRPASGNKNDKVAADFAFGPARLIYENSADSTLL